ncbi:adenine phosphoribosyltransferase [Prochlorococcus marinus]|uniref:Adenine phosphoribosyltransferase n=1 Tax=Prochlorococcus marinus (strain MIT 9211) TaxID=93059 RepID=APT_PROM4|nr:adenine phosphoribosyltransferase [Prochlorococcus marinus]A9BC43.1 RecName: Full=Adenine phosphoribosyltransferase; Short=APRT [Prochlorococcus marinus str. MIT 9211]ABX09405.1 Adenine/guanine phosphoribosyltransferases and related PRPP-binding protein [Prochlorococcus marinus str. MIT 9211]
MMSNYLSQLISQHKDFPKKGIVFKDVLPLLQHPNELEGLIQGMSTGQIFESSDAIVSIDARGFIFGTAISMKLSKPMIVARKPGKLPGELITHSYELEYGQNSLSIQKKAIENYQSFVIVDDLLATGGTAMCVSEMLKEAGKDITGLSVVVELGQLNARAYLPFPVESQIIF